MTYAIVVVLKHEITKGADLVFGQMLFMLVRFTMVDGAVAGVGFIFRCMMLHLMRMTDQVKNARADIPHQVRRNEQQRQHGVYHILSYIAGNPKHADP